MKRFVLFACFVATFAASPAAAQTDAPRIFLDQPERIVEYQLNRLSAEQLVAVERRDTDARYRPVYLALLTRAGVPRSVRDEAVTALVKLGAPSASHALLLALSKVPADAAVVTEMLTQWLTWQQPSELALRRDVFLQTAADSSSSASAATAAYGALLAVDPEVKTIWELAASRPGHLRLLLESVPHLPQDRSGQSYRDDVAALITDSLANGRLATDERAAAVRALGPRNDEASALLVANLLRTSADRSVRESAASTLNRHSALASRIPVAERTAVVEAIASWVASLEPAERAQSAILDALALGESLAGRLPADQRVAAARSVRALGAKVVRIRALPEQVSFDVRWFAVEAGRPVQLVLFNPDAMPHNLVVGKPGTLKTIGEAAGVMSMPAEPSAKAFVPDLPDVLFSTRLAQQGETLRLSFPAPSEPGNYVFACTFPGHWVRMYGVMLVVPNLEAWEAKPTVPNDPMTGRPF